MLDSTQQVEQFMMLRGKDESELQAMCEGLNLEPEGTKEELIRRLVQFGEATPQKDILVPQAIALRTNDDHGQRMQQAYDAIKLWRKQIFEAKDNYREFTLTDTKGRTYTSRMRYIACAARALEVIIDKVWYHPETSQKDLIALLRGHPNRFEVNIIQRSTENGGSYIMLHVEPQKEEEHALPEDCPPNEPDDPGAYQEQV